MTKEDIATRVIFYTKQYQIYLCIYFYYFKIVFFRNWGKLIDREQQRTNKAGKLTRNSKTSIIDLGV